MDPTPKRYTNSGVFLRTGNPMDPVQTGLEMQVQSGGRTGKHEFGAIYDAAACVRNPSRPGDDPANPWNQVEVEARGPIVKIRVNGEVVTEMNLDQYTEARKNADGSKNKYNKPLKDFPRKGYLGLQDHGDGTKCSYRNIRILEL